MLTANAGASSISSKLRIAEETSTRSSSMESVSNRSGFKGSNIELILYSSKPDDWEPSKKLKGRKSFVTEEINYKREPSSSPSPNEPLDFASLGSSQEIDQTNDLMKEKNRKLRRRIRKLKAKLKDMASEKSVTDGELELGYRFFNIWLCLPTPARPTNSHSLFTLNMDTNTSLSTADEIHDWIMQSVESARGWKEHSQLLSEELELDTSRKACFGQSQGCARIPAHIDLPNLSEDASMETLLSHFGASEEQKSASSVIQLMVPVKIRDVTPKPISSIPSRKRSASNLGETSKRQR